MAKLPYMPFYPTDYYKDTRCLSLNARAVWMDLLCHLWHARKRGKDTMTLAGWSGIPGLAPSEFVPILHELRFNKIGNVKETGDNITIVSRRMVREERERKLNRMRQIRFRNADVTASKRTSNADVTPDISEVRSQKSEVISEKKEKTFLSDSGEVRLSELLWKLIKTRSPEHKPPNLQSWARHVDLMLRVDKRKAEDIEALIVWVQADVFWQNNILSIEKLRKQYDQLQLKRKANGTQAIPPMPGPEDPIGRQLWRKTHGKEKQP